MGTSIVIGIDVIGNATTKLFWATKFVDVDELGFEAAEPALDYDTQTSQVKSRSKAGYN